MSDLNPAEKPQNSPGAIQLGASPKPNAAASAAATAPASSNWGAWALIALAIAAVVSLAVANTVGLGKPGASLASGQGASAGTASSDAPTKTIDITVEGLRFVPASIDIPAGTHLIVNFTNTGDMVHDLKIGSAETGRVDPGKTVVLDAGIINESIEGICTIAGHAQQGMRLQVNVSAAAQSNSTDAMAGMNHEHAVAGNENPYVTVPDVAARTQARDGYKAVDASLAPAPTGTTHEVRWDMTEEMVEVAPGVTQMRWLFNGQAPGPTLRGKVGDKFKVTIVNKGTMAHSIDFHAGEVTPDNNMKSINPGEELTYEFTANHAGIWMYHCSSAPMSLHIANGMAGAVIIDPADLGHVDAEYSLIADEVFLGQADQGADAQRVADGNFDLTAFNYYPNQYDLAPLHAKVGQTVRFWVLNVGPDQPMSFHLVGEQFDTVYREGAYTLKKGGDGASQALDLLPAQGGFVEVTFNQPGTYSFVNHVMTDAEKGQHGKIVVE